MKTQNTTQNYASAKNLSDIHLNGVSIDWTKVDKGVREVRLRDGNGGHVVIRANYYSDTLTVLVPAEPEQVDRWLLEGKFLGLVDVREFFEDEWSAKSKLGEYESKARGDDTGLTIKKVKVQVDDAGAAVSDPIPF